MGQQDVYQEYKEHYQKEPPYFANFKMQNGLFAIIILFIFFFVFILFANVFYLFANQGKGMEVLHYTAASWFTVSSNPKQLLMQPYTLLTFGFVHAGQKVSLVAANLVANCFWLFAFGSLIKNKLGNYKTIFPLFLMGSILGAVLFVLLGFNKNLSLEGPLAGIATLAGAAVALQPAARFKPFNASASLLALIFLALATYISYNINYFVTVGVYAGFVLGIAFAGLLKKNINITNWFVNGYQAIINAFNHSANKSNAKQNIFYNTHGIPPYTRRSIITQQKLDAILEKISAQGIDALTPEEKDFLDRASQV
jgi:hypothetical protein